MIPRPATVRFFPLFDQSGVLLSLGTNTNLSETRRIQLERPRNLALVIGLFPSPTFHISKCRQNMRHRLVRTANGTSQNIGRRRCRQMCTGVGQQQAVHLHGGQDLSHTCILQPLRRSQHIGTLPAVRVDASFVHMLSFVHKGLAQGPLAVRTASHPRREPRLL